VLRKASNLLAMSKGSPSGSLLSRSLGMPTETVEDGDVVL
jgi:hypothetical protein